LVLDGVYTTDGPDSIPVFHTAPPLTQDEVQRVRQSIHRRINRVLNAHGLLSSPGSDPSPITDEQDSLLPFLQAASMQSRVALGPDSGRPIPRLADHTAATPGPHSLPPLTSNEQGYSLSRRPLTSPQPIAPYASASAGIFPAHLSPKAASP
jgi:hypothetical protein